MVADDSLRTNIALKISCSQCGEVLTARQEKTKKECQSAYNLDMILSINPCETCIEVLVRPIKEIKAALDAAKVVLR